MEFFRIVDVQTNEAEIKNQVNFKTLSEIYPEIIVLKGNKDESLIGSFWGEFILRRDEIMGGVRFSMLNCPNAISWTITTGYPPARNKIVIHFTLNRQQKRDDFIGEINELIDGIANGLKQRFQ